MPRINLLADSTYTVAAGLRILSFPVRCRGELSWIRIGVRTGSPELYRTTAVRKVYPFRYVRTPRAPWEDK